MKYGKNLGLDQVLGEIKIGKTPAQISKEHGIPKQTLSYSTTRLKSLGCVEYNKETREWKWLKEVPIRPKDTYKVNSDIRGHAFIWNIEFLEERLDWEQIKKNYKHRKPKSKLTFKKICNGKVNRIIFKGRKVWLTKTGLTIYEPMDFIGKSSFSVKGTAVFEMDRLVKALIKEFSLRMQYYRFKCSREHYAHMKNQIARQFNDKKQKIRVNYEGKWFWIDHSQGEHEEETNDPNTSRQAQIEYKEKVADGFNITRPSVIKKSFEESSEQIKQVSGQIGEIVKQRGQDFKMISKLSREIAIHIPAYEGMHKEVTRLNKLLLSKEKQEEERHKALLGALNRLSKK